MSDNHHPEKITYIGKVDFRNKQIPFGIKEKDRTKHTYIIGKSGMGKSTLLENLAIQDINNGEGLCVVDPHGSMAEKLLDHIPESRIKDVVYFAPFDGEYPIGLNMLEKVSPDKRFLVANGLMSAFKKIFTDGDGKGTFSARMEYVLNNIILALLENDGQTLLGVNRMLFDKDYRKFIVSNVTDPTVRDFWVNEYANYTEKTAQDLAPAIQNKIGQFVSNPLIRNIIGQQKTSFDIRKLMDEKKILIVNLSKGKVGEGNANLLGSLFITKIYLAAMSRADVDPYAAEKLPPFYFYVDEFQNFANESFASILSEARKYKLALTVAHQYIEQMTDEVRSAVFGNVGTMITFRVGATDAEIFEKEFAPIFIMDDFVNLSAFQIYLRLMIDSQGSKPFSAHTLDPIQKPAQSFANAVIAHSRATYAKQRFTAEEEITEFYKPIPKLEKKKEESFPVPSVGHNTSPHQITPQTLTERHVPVRAIHNTTPLPPKKHFEERTQTQTRTPAHASTRHEEFRGQKNYETKQTELKHRNVRKDEEYKQASFTTPAHREERGHHDRSSGYIKNNIDSPSETVHGVPTKEVTHNTQNQALHHQNGPVIFDNKPALSLKEALDRALNESNKEMKVEEFTKPRNAEAKSTTEQVQKEFKEPQEIKKTTKEISEEALRKLIEGE
jgi:energy-coupling factor transporter ATP-binding protein EcfA2